MFVFGGPILIFIFIIGVCLGSFFNVVILRSISGESIIAPPSKCPKCGTRLKPWHNIPIISYLLLGGKCAYCKEKISRQYPVVEFITGLLFVVIYGKYGSYNVTWLFMFCISCLLIMTVTDLKTKTVDCIYAIAMAGIGILLSFFSLGLVHGIDAILGAAIGFIAIELIARTGYLLHKGRAMGEADSYIAAALGAIVGTHSIGWVLLYSLIASMVFVLPIFWYNRYKEGDALSLLLSALFIMSMALTTIFQNAYWTLAILGITGMVLAFRIIKSIRINQKVSYLPFVPALSAGFLYYIIFVM